LIGRVVGVLGKQVSVDDLGSVPIVVCCPVCFWSSGYSVDTKVNDNCLGYPGLWRHDLFHFSSMFNSMRICGRELGAELLSILPNGLLKSRLSAYFG